MKLEIDKMEAKRSGTETGDAYWTWESSEYIPTPTDKSFAELLPDGQTPEDAVIEALDSFGIPDPKNVRAAALIAWREVIIEDH